MPAADLIPLTAGRIVGSLMMKWDAILSLLHWHNLRLGARSSRQIGVSSARGKVRRSRCEVMFRKRGNASADVVPVLLRGVVVRLVATRVE